MLMYYKNEKFSFYNNLDIRRVIVRSIVCLCITKMEKFLHKLYSSVQYLLKCSAFGSVFNKVTSIAF